MKKIEFEKKIEKEVNNIAEYISKEYKVVKVSQFNVIYKRNIVSANEGSSAREVDFNEFIDEIELKDNYLKCAIFFHKDINELYYEKKNITLGKFDIKKFDLSKIAEYLDVNDYKMINLYIYIIFPSYSDEDTFIDYTLGLRVSFVVEDIF